MNDFTKFMADFFRNNFKLKFLIFISFPLFLSTIFLIDFLLLPDVEKNEQIEYLQIISLPQNVIGNSVRSSRNMGFKYFTTNNYEFTSLGDKLKDANIVIEISPIFKIIKNVKVSGNPIKIDSGISGINGLLMCLGYPTMLISIGYVLLVKNISENARLNLIFLHFCLFALWATVIGKYA